MWGMMKAWQQQKSTVFTLRGFTDANQEFIVSFPKQLDLLVAKAYVLGFEDLPVRRLTADDDI